MDVLPEFARPIMRTLKENFGVGRWDVGETEFWFPMFLRIVEQESPIDLILTKAPTFLLWQPETGRDHFGFGFTVTHAAACISITPMSSLKFSPKFTFHIHRLLFRDTYVHLQLLHQVVSERQPHDADDLASTNR